VTRTLILKFNSTKEDAGADRIGLASANEMKHYMDIKLVPAVGMMPPILASEVVKTVHKHLHDHPGTVAVALPECKAGAERKVGTLVRLFAVEGDHLEVIADAIEARKALNGLAIPMRIRTVPAEVGKWAAYTRFRLPNRRRQPKDTDAFAIRRQQLRAEGLAMMDTLPTIYMTSTGNGHRYGMGIQVMESADPAPQGVLNGYGLSSRTEPYWLPLL